MPKLKPEIPTGKFVILDRINKQGETTIHLRFHMDGYVKRSTGIGIPPSGKVARVRPPEAVRV